MAKTNSPGGDDAGRKGLMITIALMICLGLGAGASFARFVVTKHHGANRAGGATRDSANARQGGGHEYAGGPGARDVSTEHIIPLEPIITNIAGAGRTWLRFEGSIVLSERFKDDRTVLTAQISQDLMGLLRSTTLRQLESAAGLEFLREDMAELARLRSKGRARDIIIKVLVVE